MKTQRQLLSVAWLAACVLLLLSACRGPTPIAGRVAEITATRGASNTPLPSTPTVAPTPTPTETPAPPATVTPTSTETPAPSGTHPPGLTETPTAIRTPTPNPDDIKPARPTPTEIPMPKPPEIAGYSLRQGQDSGWVYVDKSGKEVAHTARFSFEGLNWKNTIQRGALVVSDEKMMAYLLKAAGEGRGKSEIPLFPLPFNPEGLELQEKKFRGVTEIAIKGRIQEVVQPFPGSITVLLNNYSDSSAIAFFPNKNNISGFTVTAPSLISPLLPFRDTTKPFGKGLATNFSGTLPPRYNLPGANAVITARNSNGVSSVILDDFASVGGFTVAAGH